MDVWNFFSKNMNVLVSDWLSVEVKLFPVQGLRSTLRAREAGVDIHIRE